MSEPLWDNSRDKKLRERSLRRLWERAYRKYRKMIDGGFIQDSKTGRWKKIAKP